MHTIKQTMKYFLHGTIKNYTHGSQKKTLLIRTAYIDQKITS